MWLGTHGMEVGAVSVMLYCFRERELLLNINEMLAGFRLFPSYMRIGGLREDLPRGFHDAVRAFLDRLPAKLDEYEDLLTKNEIYLKRTQGVGVDFEGRRGGLRAGRTDRARPPASTTTCGRPFRISATTPSTSTCPTRTRGDVYARYLVRVAEMRESVKICRQALERITPTGPFAIDDPRITPPPKDRVYTEMEALIQHFLVYSQGFTVPAGEAYVPVEGPRGEHGFYVVSDGTNRPWRIKSRAPSLLACQALETHDRRRADCRRDRRHRIDRRRDGRRGPVTFHPEMAYGATFHKSSRKLEERGPPFAYTPEQSRALRRDRHAISARSPPVGGAAGAVPRAAPAGLHHRERDALRRRPAGHHAGRRRGRRVVLHDVLHEAGRHASC